MPHNGPIDWTQARHNALTVLTSIGLEDDGMGNQSSVTSACANQATHVVARSLYRRKADIDYDKPCTIPTLARGPNLI